MAFLSHKLRFLLLPGITPALTLALTLALTPALTTNPLKGLVVNTSGVAATAKRLV